MVERRRRARGELEAQVMEVLWASDDWRSPAEVLDDVSTARRPLAYTTVMTILVRLWKKGALDRRRDGRAYVYRPVSTRAEWTARRMTELLDQAGDPAVALSHFVDAIDPQDARRLRRLLGRGRG